jgi:predicted nucleic acid-binding protein
MSTPVFAPTAVFCNSGPLIAFGKLNRLDLLAGVYQQAQIPEAVYHEVEAYRRRQLTQPHLALLLDEIAARPDIWIRASLCKQILENLPDLLPLEE